MVILVKMLSAKPDNLSANPGAPMEEGCHNLPSSPNACLGKEDLCQLKSLLFLSYKVFIAKSHWSGSRPLASATLLMLGRYWSSSVVPCVTEVLQLWVCRTGPFTVRQITDRVDVGTAAEYVKSRLPETLKQHLQDYEKDKENSVLSYQTILEQQILSIDREMLEKLTVSYDEAVPDNNVFAPSQMTLKCSILTCCFSCCLTLSLSSANNFLFEAIDVHSL
ncbi:hypothetical protein STEG23_019818 [Scotinomys teguina]